MVQATGTTSDKKSSGLQTITVVDGGITLIIENMLTP